MASVPLKLAIATLLYPPPKEGPHLDADAIKAHRETIALRSLRNACKDDADKEEMITAILEAAKARGEDVSDEEIKTALGALQAVEKLIADAGIVSAPPSDRDAFLKELEGVDRDANNNFGEGALRPDLSQFGVADDAEIPPRLHGAIRGYAWIKGALYSHNEPEWEEDENEPQPPNVPDVISDADADLFAALGMGDVVKTMKEAVKAGVDPLAKARQAAREADTPPAGRNPGGEDDTPDNTRRNAATGHTVIDIDPPPPIPPEVKAAFARMTAHAREVEKSNMEYARVSAIVLNLLRGCLAQRASVEDAVALYHLVNNVDAVGVATVIFLEASDEELLAHDWMSPETIAPLLVRKDETFVFTSADSAAFGRAVTERIEVIRNPPPPESAEERERRERRAAAVADRMSFFENKRAEAARVAAEETARQAEAARVAAEKAATEAASKAAAPPAGPPSP